MRDRENSVMRKLFKANRYSSSEIHRQCDPLPDVSQLGDLVWSDASSFMLPDPYAFWLQDSGSLTAKLQQYTASLSLQLLTSGWQLADSQNARLLMRQVLLSDGMHPWVWGLTVVDTEFLAAEPELLNWSTQPLGALLFADNNEVTRNFDVADFSQSCSFQKILSVWGCQPQEPLYGRRSMMQYGSCPFSLMEVFLPDHPMYGVSL
jgi:chorismate lyase